MAKLHSASPRQITSPFTREIISKLHSKACNNRGRVAKGVEERVELFVGGSTIEELEVDGRVASVEAGRVAKGVEVVEL